MADYDDGWSPQECNSIDASGNRDFSNSIYGDGETVKISDLISSDDDEKDDKEDDEQRSNSNESGGSSPVNDG